MTTNRTICRPSRGWYGTNDIVGGVSSRTTQVGSAIIPRGVFERSIEVIYRRGMLKVTRLPLLWCRVVRVTSFLATQWTHDGMARQAEGGRRKADDSKLPFRLHTSSPPGL